jgi:hypothetical protein
MRPELFRNARRELDGTIGRALCLPPTTDNYGFPARIQVQHLHRGEPIVGAGRDTNGVDVRTPMTWMGRLWRRAELAIFATEDSSKSRRESFELWRSEY